MMDNNDPNNQQQQQDPQMIHHHHQLHSAAAGGGGSSSTTSPSLQVSSSSMIPGPPKDGSGPPPLPGALKQMPDDPSQAAMYKLLGSRLRCTLSDGRIATGTFICMDRLKNMIMMDVLEERIIDPSNYDPTYNDNNSSSNNTTTTTSMSRRVPVQRELSQAMIPGKHLVKVEIEKEEYEKRN